MKDVVDAINSRIKSPYFGYAVLAFFALNWRGIFLLAVSTGSPAERLQLFDTETSFWSLAILPLIIGALVAASTHWLRYLFLLVAKKPLGLIENSNLEAEHRKFIRQAELEQVRADLAAQRESELIDRAKRDESIAEISDESKKKELEEEIKKIRNERDVKLSEKARELLLSAASEDKGVIMTPKTLGEQSIQAGKKSFGKNSKRDYAEYQSALNELVTSRYVQPVGHKGEIYELTHEGWQLADAL
ncbi:hypothetical protein SAMN02745127_02821 [Oceanospirillum multiglobuliferum]|uniref:Uncharacterized protein n=1 Tax=Oceanospirillum multiglobuliferum TaxID=64969 RepID=A0A1T4S8N0_9GAMM|nr:hypothetical protein [Oceanospirillum multiglobuliferum]OPX54398.1 hypothetical protein BTE48_14295 [Oceanospirillum multiglobuliferum]SKA24258.1 hypothetical protein SAMN02745127_02821 [Oceanospirillum multiglobuliferum]